ncbi:cupin domain-containing protein [Flammeovirgaceae bacterium 311]|nr:cupin domain-containing protein [Flammeovirgaceae bacterium 311]
MPHDRDEVYIIATGSGKFMLEEELTAFKAGDFLFVPAGANHRFVEFTDDFSTWVLFYGPPGGERSEPINHLS